MTNQPKTAKPDPQNDPVDLDYYCKKCGMRVKKADISTHVCKPDSTKQDTEIQ